MTCAVALAFVAATWPFTRWSGSIADLGEPARLVVPALANAVVLVSGFLAAVSLVWGIADSPDGPAPRPPQLRCAPRPCAALARRAPVRHPRRRGALRLSHRERPRGAARQWRVRAGVGSELRHTPRSTWPLDLVLITGDMTDAGRSAEWAEFLDALALYPCSGGEDLDPPRLS